MKSAYLVLGIPMHATPEEIRAAYIRKTKILQRQEELSGPLAVAARHAELKVAYKILRDDEQRAAHDLTLNQATAGTPSTDDTPPRKATPAATVLQTSEPSPVKWVALAVVAVVVLGGLWLNQVRLDRVRERAEAQAAAAAVALQKEQAEAQAREKRQQEEDRIAQRVQQDAERKASYQEQQLRREMEQVGRRVQMDESLRQANEHRRISMELQEGRRLEAEARMNEERRQMEARRIAESDKRQIRELCMQNYGRPNC